MARARSSPSIDPQIVIRGARWHPLRDIYHVLLRASWPLVLGFLTAIYLAINTAFAALYLHVGGVANAEPGSLRDAFFFSVQTLATIGYGGMYPESYAANVIMTAESIIGVLVTAIFTGLVFAKFATATARIVFSRAIVISPRDGIPTLMLRIGNDRNDSVLDARVRVVLIRTPERPRASSSIGWSTSRSAATSHPYSPARSC